MHGIGMLLYGLASSTDLDLVLYSCTTVLLIVALFILRYHANTYRMNIEWRVGRGRPGGPLARPKCARRARRER
jgi:hypothetical protein